MHHKSKNLHRLFAILMLAAAALVSPFFVRTLTADGEINNPAIYLLTVLVSAWLITVAASLLALHCGALVNKLAHLYLVNSTVAMLALFLSGLMLELLDKSQHVTAGIPNTKIEFRSLENGLIEYQYNNTGFRSQHDYKFNHSNAEYALVGDSFVFGVMVPQTETFDALLTKLIPETTFLNFGIPGASPLDYELIIKQQEIDKISGINLIVFYYVDNDFIGNSFNVAYDINNLQILKLINSVLSKRSIQSSTEECPANLSHKVCTAISDGLVSKFLISRGGVGNNEDFYEEISEFIAKPNGPVFQHFERIRSIADSVSGRTLVVIIPSKFQVRDDYIKSAKKHLGYAFSGEQKLSDKPQRELRKLCARVGLDCLDLLPNLLENNAYFSIDDHFNSLGNKITAETVYRYLINTKQAE